MSRFVSFFVLAAIVLVIGILSYQVMAIFLLPIFLATLLVVLFKPLHLWLIERTGGRVQVAAVLTTLAVLLIVLLPTTLVIIQAANEAVGLVQSLDHEDLARRWTRLRHRLNMNLPPNEVDQRLSNIEHALHGWRLALEPDEADLNEPLPPRDELINAMTENSQAIEKLLDLGPDDEPDDSLVAQSWHNWRASLTELIESADTPEAQPDAVALPPLVAGEINLARFRTQLYGNPLIAWAKRQANLDSTRMAALQSEVQNWLGPVAIGAPLWIGEVFVKLLIGLIVMVVSLYYFLADGPEMITTLMKLSPLDEQYVTEMLLEFGKISRAIVFAMLLAALAQGLLGGIGYYFAGLESVFLLTMLTALMSLIPFVGTGAVWMTCCLWLFFVDGHTGAAIGLAIWGALIVSTADNIVKPLVLHGQSNLHPLLALLSVLGGVQALGPIGIFVGPMVVAFLYAVLVMLRRELSQMDRNAPGDHALQG